MKKSIICATRYIFLILFIGLVQGCQLPSRPNDFKTGPIQLDSEWVIDSNNGLLSEGLSSLPGAICLPDKNAAKSGKFTCDTTMISPSQCIKQGTTIEIKPETNPTPKYHYMVSGKYDGKISAPVIKYDVGAEYLTEVTATIAATAKLKGLDSDQGYPQLEGLKACMLKIYGGGEYPRIIWIKAANIYTINRRYFKKVSNAFGVNYSGFGLDGNTYNQEGQEQQEVWVTLFPFAPTIGSVSSPVIASSLVSVATENKGSTSKPIAVVNNLNPPSAQLPGVLSSPADFVDHSSGNQPSPDSTGSPTNISPPSP